MTAANNEIKLKRKRIWRSIVITLAAITVFITTYAMILPAITMTLTCGKTEHVHTDECYGERVKYYATVLNCPKDEHVHGDSCYDASGKLICNMAEHKHTDECYGESKPVYEKYLTCALEEHTHTELCYDSIFRTKLAAVNPTGNSGTIEWRFTPASDGSYKLYVGGTGAIPSEFYTNEDIAAALAEIEANGALVDLVIGKDITTVGGYAFYNLNMISSVEFEDYSACTIIGQSAFRACANCTTVTFPEHNSLTKINQYAFYRMQTLKNVNLEACTSLESIGDAAFAEYNDIVSVKLPASVKTLGTSCFASCAELTTCDIAVCDLLEGIPQTCFLGDTKLKAITIPSGCTYIKAQAFQNCYALESVHFEENHSDQFVFYQRCFAMVGEAKNHTALKEFNMEALGTCGSVGMYHGGETFSMFMYGGPENIIIPSNFVGGVTGTYKGSLYCLFHYATNVKHITFLENDNPLKLGNTFAAHTGIYELDLRPLKNVTGTIHLPYGGTGTLDPELNLETIYIPEKATQLESGYSCPNLKYIIFPDGSAMTKIGGFNTDAGLEEIDLSDLEKLKTISAAFHDDANLSVIILPNNGLNILLDDSFYNDPSLVEVDLTDSSVYQLSCVFYNDENLKKIALPTSFYQPYGTVSDSTQPDGYIHKGILYNDPALEDVYIDSVRIMDTKNTSGKPNTRMYSEDSFTNCGPFILHFGPDVDRLPIEFLQDASRSCGAILFAGNNNILFTKNEETEHKGAKLPSMLRDLEGEYFADASGVLYKLNDDGTATLVYVPPFIHGSADDDKWGETPLTSYTIPASITDANGNTYEVTAVREDAFLLAANLKELNGKTMMAEASTALDALGFSGVDLNNTQLIGAEHHEDESKDYSYPDTSGLNVITDPIVVAEEHYETDEEGNRRMVGTKLTISTSYTDLYTNESSKDPNNPNNIIVNLGNTLSTDSKVARIYFCFSDPDYVFVDEALLGVEQSSTTGANSFNYTINRVEGTDFYYLDIGPVAPGTTGSIDFQPMFESPDTPGGKLLIWGELLDDPDEEPVKRFTDRTEMHEITWSTIPDPFALSKTAGTGHKIVKNDTEYLISGLNFNLTLSRIGSALTLGKNYISTVDFEDVLTLPEDIVWRDGILDAITAGNYRFDRSAASHTLYATVDGVEYLVCTVSVKNMGNVIPTVENGKLTLRWSATNTSTTAEYSMGTGTVVYGNNVLMLDSGYDISEEKTLVIHNDADALVRYRYDNAVYDPPKVAAEVELVTGHTELTVSKTQSAKDGYWGMPQTFTLTALNNTAFPYEGFLGVSDPLTSLYYIKPADIVKMFGEDLNKDLTITIDDATICSGTYVPVKITTVDGRTKATTSITNSSQWADDEYADNYYIGTNGTVGDIAATQQNRIVLHWNGDGTALILELYPNKSATTPTLTMTVPAESDGGFDIAGAFERIRFMPTSPCTYACSWTLNPENTTVAPQSSRVYKIYATFKDTFIFLANDINNLHKTANYGNAVYNTATFHLQNEANKTSKISTNSFKRDFELYKSIIQNGTAIGDGNPLQDESVLENTLKIVHHGTGRYDLVPLVDRVTGSQMVMAKVSDNADASWAAEITDIVEYNGEAYYLLGVPAGETYRKYEGVRIGEYYAESVEVDKTATGFSSLIKWYFSNAFGREMTLNLTYPTYVSCARSGISSGAFNGNNRVWLGDHPTHRLFASFGVGGTDVNFNKYVLTDEEGENYSGSEKSDFLLKKYSAIYRGSEVIYRLRLIFSGSGKIVGADLYDILPKNFDKFSWTAGTNVEILSYEYDPAVVTVTNGDSWSISNKPNGQPAFVPEAGQYFLNWAMDDTSTPDVNEGFLAQFSSTGILDIYVKLTFPSDNSWDAFCAALAGNQITNTMMFKELPDSVQHDVIAPVSAKLQKGVYDTGFMTNMKTTVSTASYPYVKRNNTKVYTNDVNVSQARVTYYADLYNEGPGRLYLDTIQDVLPKGFTFFGLVNAETTYTNYILYPYFQLTTGAKIGYTSALTERTKYTSTNDQVTGSYHAYADSGSYKAKPLSVVTRGDGKSVTYVVAQLTVDTSLTTEDGRQLLRITVDGNDSACTLSYDEKVGRWYLKPGECLRFGYDALTNGYSRTEDQAPNSMAMPVPDPYDAGVTLGTAETVSPNNTLAPNDGTAAMITTGAAHSKMFDGGDINTKWLSSDVTVHREPIQPGIVKHDTRIINTNGDERASAGNVGYGETVIWETNITNTGLSAMCGYTFTDTMQAPFRFTGPVYFDLSEESGLQTGTYAHGRNEGKDRSPIITSGQQYSECSKKYPLFTLRRDESGNCFISLNGNEVQMTSGVPVRVGGTGASVALKTYTYYYHTVGNSGKGEITGYISESVHGYDVTWSRDADGNETLSIKFVNDLFGIPANGTMWLRYGTQEVTNSHENKTYINQAWVTPTQPFDHDTINNGNYDETLGAPSVYDDEPVSVVSGYITSASKAVTEIIHPDNTASTETDTRWILLESADSAFTYTLTVNGTPSNVMERMVIIDNLPQINDHSTFALTVPRSSAFDVSFADNPNVRVFINGTELDSDDFEFAFSSKTGFSDNDWAGNNTNGNWVDSSDGMRSLRIILKDVAKGSTITVKFDAKVTDKDQAEPGTIAWNNFGYSYVVSGTTLQASPSNVGVRVPSVPKLQKKTVLNGQPYEAFDDADFIFCVYEGEAVSGIDSMTRAEIATALEGREYHFVTIHVPKGSTESALTTLEEDDNGEKLSTFWVTGSKYSITELNPGQDYRFSTLNMDDEKTYTFTYQNDKNLTVTAVNNRRVWQILLYKTDSKETDIMLAGAVFGLFSPNAEDQLPAEDIGGSAPTVTYDGVTYYLASIKSTDGYGMISWNTLFEDNYVVKELVAPKGYYLDDTLHPLSRDDSIDDVVEVAYVNECTYRLPSTGGIGNTILYTLAFILMAGGAVLGAVALGRKRKKIGEND